MKKGDYVVFLTLNGKKTYGNIPTGYVYQLREDYNTHSFYIVEDMNGNMTNGYSSDHSKSALRPATLNEIARYIAKDGPVPADREDVYEIF